MSARRIPSHTRDATSVALSDVPFKDTSSYFPSVYLQHLGLFYLLQPITFVIPLPTCSRQIRRTNAAPERVRAPACLWEGGGAGEAAAGGS